MIQKISAQDAIDHLKSNLSLRQKDKDTDSYYRDIKTEKQTTYLRVSNHYTFLFTWIKHDLKNIDTLYNISITFLDVFGKPNNQHTTVSQDEINKAIRNNKNLFQYPKTQNYYVTQYVYISDLLDIEDVTNIAKNISSIIRCETDIYEDPLENDSIKYARIYRLSLNKTPEIIKEDFETPSIKNHLYECIMKDVAKIVKKALLEYETH